MFFKGRGYFVLSVATKVDMRSGYLIFENRYIQKKSNGTIGFQIKKDNNCIFSFFRNDFTYLQTSDQAHWLASTKVDDHKYKFKQCSKISDAAKLMILPIKPEDNLMVWLADDANGLVGTALNGDPHGECFLAYTLSTSTWIPDYTLPPLSEYNSETKNNDYSTLPFEGGQIKGLSLDNIIVKQCSFKGTEFNSSSFRNAKFCKAVLNSCKSSISYTKNNDFSFADFTNAVLTGTVFNNKDVFRNTIFNKADLTDADFSNAVMAGANLKGATLKNTDFRGADLSNADLSNTDLSNILIDNLTNLSFATIKNSTIHNIDLSGIDLRHTDFSFSDIDQVVFKDTKLAGTIFASTNLMTSIFDEYPSFGVTIDERTSFQKATLAFNTVKRKWNYLDLRYADLPDLPEEISSAEDTLQAENALLTGMNLTGRKFQYAHFNNSDLRSAKLDKSDLSHASMKGVLLGGDTMELAAYLTGATLFNTDLSNSIMTGVDFSGAQFYGKLSTISGATAPCVKFSDAFLAGMDFSSVKNLKGVIFDRGCLLNCNLTGCDMTPYNNVNRSSFRHTCIQGVDFSDSNLNGATLENAYVSFEPGFLTVTLPGIEPLKWNYEKTKVEPSCTGDKTICPDSSLGPCYIKQFETKDHPKQWPLVKSLFTSSK